MTAPVRFPAAAEIPQQYCRGWVWLRDRAGLEMAMDREAVQQSERVPSFLNTYRDGKRARARSELAVRGGLTANQNRNAADSGRSRLRRILLARTHAFR